MGIERRVLYNNRLGHTNAERRKIPNRLNSSRHHFIGHGLSNFNGHGKHTYINIIIISNYYNRIYNSNNRNDNK